MSEIEDLVKEREGSGQGMEEVKRAMEKRVRGWLESGEREVATRLGC